MLACPVPEEASILDFSSFRQKQSDRNMHQLHKCNASFSRLALNPELNDFFVQILIMDISSLRHATREVLVRISDNCDRRDLKALRLTCRHWHDIAVSRLFASLKIYPCAKSLERLTCVANNDRLRRLVRTLQYDGTILSSTGKLGADIDNASLFLYLRKAFSALTGLRAISVIDASYDRDVRLENHLPEIIRQSGNDVPADPQERAALSRIQCQFSGCLTSHVCSILRALHHLPNPVEVLDVQGFFWSRLLCSGQSGQSGEISDTSFAALKNLHLQPMSQSIFFGSINMPDLQYVLQAAINLESLHIDFGMAQCGRAGEPQSVFGAALSTSASLQTLIARLSWSSSITSLHLSGLVCTLAELQSVLSYCTDSLRSLSLENLTLIPEAPDAPRACLVAMLDWIRASMNLEEVNFSGYMSNEGLQQWNVTDTDHGSSSLLARVQHFILDGGPCPLEDVAIQAGHFDFARKLSSSTVSDHVLRDFGLRGDDSWQMGYDIDEDMDWSSDEDEYMDNLGGDIWNRVQIQAA